MADSTATGSDSPKYLSRVFVAASRTRWQSGQAFKCRAISRRTLGESFPSKYQQIKWIVSRQLMTRVPQQDPRRDQAHLLGSIFRTKRRAVGHFNKGLIINELEAFKKTWFFRLGTRPKTLHGAIPRATQSSLWADHRCGTTVISRRAAMRSSRGGCVLKREEAKPPPNIGFTMHKVEVEGERAVVGIRWL